VAEQPVATSIAACADAWLMRVAMRRLRRRRLLRVLICVLRC